MFKLFQILCKKGTDNMENLLEAGNNDGFTPFMLSVQNMNYEIMEYLITGSF